MKFLPAATLLFLSSTASAFEVTSTSNSLVPQSTTAEYSCTLTNLWSAATQPVGYPGGSAHWTDPVLAAHSSGYTMWAPGQTATTGIENVAELGSTGSLRNELNANTNVKEFVVGDDQFNNRDPPQTLPTIEVDSSNPLLSVITMVAPSPDWFTGFYNFEPANSATGTWYREFTIDSFPWDAGTENGGAFVLGNTATSPRGTIFELTVDTVPSSGAFLNQAGGDTVLPLATWTCNLETPDPPQVFEPFTVVSKTDSAVLASQPGLVDFVCEFDNDWSGSRHPALYPSNAHWSPPIVASHSSSYTMWEEGGLATAGVELVAETGGTGALEDELANEGDDVEDVVRGSLTFNSQQQEQTFASIRLTKNNRYMSSITMVAPSPDWYTGFYNFEAVNPDNNMWYREFVIETYPWDAGTEDGSTYSGSNSASNPIETIKRFNPNNVPSTGVFLNGGGNQILPVATWTCTLQQEDPAQGFGACFSGETTVEVQSKGIVSMKHLEVGDKVKVDNDTFEPVYGFGHQSETKKTSYLQIYGKDAGRAPLEITKDHMVFVVEEDTQKAVPASMVKVGDTLLAGNENVVKVSKIKSVERDGAFAPFTMSGTIVVNGIVSSSYVSLQDDADTLVISGVDTQIGWHTVAHVCTTPFRLAARLGLLAPETYNDEGVSEWIEGPHRMAVYVMNESHYLVTLVALVGLASVMAPLFLAEQLLTTPIIGAGLAAALYWWSRQSKKTKQL